MRREERYHVVVIEREAARAESLRVRGQIQSPAENARLQLCGPISTISEAVENVVKVGEKEYDEAGVGRQILLESEVARLLAESPFLEQLERPAPAIEGIRTG